MESGRGFKRRGRSGSRGGGGEEMYCAIQSKPVLMEHKQVEPVPFVHWRTQKLHLPSLKGPVESLISNATQPIQG